LCFAVIYTDVREIFVVMIWYGRWAPKGDYASVLRETRLESKGADKVPILARPNG
jgi:hypothetical protein